MFGIDLTDLVIINVLLWGGLMIVLVIGSTYGYQIDTDEKKKKRDAARAGAAGQVHQDTVDVTESLDARPRKTSGPVRSKKVLPWQQ